MAEPEWAAPPTAPDFWLSSGFRLLERDASGHLRVTDAFLRAYWNRPEMQPVAESCADERALRGALLETPRLPVPPDRVMRLADPDARDNYRTVLRLRDRLLASGTLEGAYLALFRGGAIDIPPLFVDQLVHAILRNILDECVAPIELRAAELLFRAQKVNVVDGAILLADEEIVDSYAETGGFGSLERLLGDSATPMSAVSLDVLSEANGTAYWPRSDRFDTVLDLTFARPGLDGLCRVLERWVRHFLGLAVRIEPVQAIRDERWAWHVGLDAEATALLNDLYQAQEVDAARMERLLSLFRLSFEDQAVVLPEVAGRPVYLGLAMNAEKVLRLKPQNLLVNLPLRAAA